MKEINLMEADLLPTSKTHIGMEFGIQLWEEKLEYLISKDFKT
jgi:hypothetical protein